jgi:formamidopyrimidine-DNA glycosylase
VPELPDVETFRGYIDATALHKHIRRVGPLDASVVANCSTSKLKRHLSGTTLDQTRRHGKHLGVHLDSGEWLMLHFGMTGYPEYAESDRDTPEHSRLVLHFDNGFRLAYVNQRKLGRVRLADDFDAFVADQDLGPDALEIERDAFEELLSDGRGTLKTRLMNQSLIAGLGNVYTDEILFQAGVHPGTPLTKLRRDQAGEIWRTMRHVLRTAIDRQADADRYPDSWLTPHRGEDRCPRCHGPLKQVKIGGRTSRYCPSCQPPPS